MLHQENFEITTSETSGGHILKQKDFVTRVIMIVGDFQVGYPLVPPHHCHVNKWMGYNNYHNSYL